MASVQLSWTATCLLLLTTFSGVCCDDNYSLGALVAASGVAFVILVVFIVMLIVALTWNRWYPHIQEGKGKVKMPREYWKKKEDAKRKLLNHSVRSHHTSVAAPSDNGLPNGHPASRVQDTGNPPASWVQGWNNVNTTHDKGYEEMALAMDLGEEREEPEFRIETTVVDNETLDLGPFRDSDVAPNSANDTVLFSQQTASLQMEEEADDYVYSVVDRSRPSSAKVASQQENPTSFSKLDPYLVAL